MDPSPQLGRVDATVRDPILAGAPPGKAERRGEEGCVVWHDEAVPVGSALQQPWKVCAIDVRPGAHDVVDSQGDQPSLGPVRPELAFEVSGSDDHGGDVKRTGWPRLVGDRDPE